MRSRCHSIHIRKHGLRTSQHMGQLQVADAVPPCEGDAGDPPSSPLPSSRRGRRRRLHRSSMLIGDEDAVVIPPWGRGKRSRPSSARPQTTQTRSSFICASALRPSKEVDDLNFGKCCQRAPCIPKGAGTSFRLPDS